MFCGGGDDRGKAGDAQMTGLLPKDLEEEFSAARRQSRRRRATRVVHVGDDVYPILDYSEDGFAVDAEDVPNLRGLVDIYEGPRHMTQALIVASAREGELMRYEFKRNTRADGQAPLDFASPLPQAVMLLGQE